MIIAGATAYPRVIDPAPLREIADEVGALLMFDAAHIAGLIAGGVHPNPVPFADIVTFTTHKTLRGPRGGCVLCRAELGRGHRQGDVPRPAGRSARARHRGQGGRVPRGGAPVVQGVRPADRRATRGRWPRRLAGEGFRLVSGGTDNHLMLVDLRQFDADLTGKEAQTVLDRAGITLNKNTIPDDPRSPFVTSGVRIGTPVGHHAGHDRAADGRRSPRSSPGRCASATTTPSWPRGPRRRRRRCCANFTPYADLSITPA